MEKMDKSAELAQRGGGVCAGGREWSSRAWPWGRKAACSAAGAAAASDAVAAWGTEDPAGELAPGGPPCLAFPGGVGVPGMGRTQSWANCPA